MAISFDPPLGSVLHLAAAASSNDKHGVASVRVSAFDVPPNKAPELWTNLPAAVAGEGCEEKDKHEQVWRAIELTRLDHAHAHGPSSSTSASPSSFWSALLEIPLGPSATELEYAFTYRLRHLPTTDGERDTSEQADKEHEYDWLGQAGDNVVLHVHSLESGVVYSLHREQVDHARVELASMSDSVSLARFDLGGDSSTAATTTATQTPLATVSNALGGVLALERSKATWCIPTTSPSSTSFPSQAIAFYGAGEVLYVAALLLLPPRSGGSTTTDSHNKAWPSLRFTDQVKDSRGRITGGELVLEALHDRSHGAQVQVAFARGRDLAHAQRHLATALGLDTSSSAPTSNGLGYCTWMSLGASYTLQDVLSALSAANSRSATTNSSSHGSAYESVLLDDGWQDLDGQGKLRSFGARKGWTQHAAGAGDSGEQDEHEHEHELKSGVRKIKDSGVQRVGVWLTSAGYWNGLSSGMEGHATTLYELKKSDAPQLAPMTSSTWLLPSDPHAFFTDYFTHLRACGVDFVKVDNQASVLLLDDFGVASALTEAVHGAASSIFGGAENVMHSMAAFEPVYGSTEVAGAVRTSDDYAREADAHRWHLVHNALVSSLLSAHHLTPDFDMFELAPTHAGEHEQAVAIAHARLRALSGAQVFVSDDVEVLGRPSAASDALVTLDSAGAQRVVQCNAHPFVLRENEDFLGSGDGRALKLVVKTSAGLTLAAWNCRADGRAWDVISRDDLAGSIGVTDAVVFTNGEWSLQDDVLAALDSPLASQTYTVAPLLNSVACVGLIDMLAPLAGVLLLSQTSPTVPAHVAPATHLVRMPTFTPRFELSALARDFKARPASTIWSEISGLLRFGSLWMLFFLRSLMARVASVPAVRRHGEISSTSTLLLRTETPYRARLGFVTTRRDGIFFLVDGSHKPAEWRKHTDGSALAVVDLTGASLKDGSYSIEVRRY